MKQIYRLFLLFGISFVLSGCISGEAAVIPFSTLTFLPSSIAILPTATPTLSQTPTSSPSPTGTSTQLTTLEPAEASEAIKTLLQEPVDCEAPCFWGIMPGQSTFDEAVRAITHFGLQLLYTNTLDNKEFRQSEYAFENGLSISTILTIQNKIVGNLRVGITPEMQKAGVPRQWLAYSPETLITRYGMPSKVSIAVDSGPRSFFDMVMYFDEVELIVEYTGYNIIGGTAASPQVCPLTDQFNHVGIWMGQNPVNPPPSGVPLEDATYLTIEEFSELMTRNSDNACFNLKSEIFP